MTNRPVNMASARGQRGVFLIEALVAILIFSFGVLAMVGTGAMAVSTQSDAQYRGEAARFAAEMINDIYPNINLTSDATIKDDLPKFSHNANTTAACNFQGGPSTETAVTAWVTRVTGNRGLPGSTTSMQQILIDGTPGGRNQVTVTLCWRAPSDSADRRLVYVGYVN